VGTLPRSFCRRSSSCGARAHLGTARVPAGDEALLQFLSLFDLQALAIARRLDIVIVGPAALAACGRLSSRQFEAAQFCRKKIWPPPRVVLLLGEQVPDQDCELSCGRYRPCCGPGRFHEQPPGMAWALLRDAAMISQCQAGLCRTLGLRPTPTTCRAAPFFTSRCPPIRAAHHDSGTATVTWSKSSPPSGPRAPLSLFAGAPRPW